MKITPRKLLLSGFVVAVALGYGMNPASAQLGDESASGEGNITELKEVVDKTDDVVSAATGLALGAFGVRQAIKAANRITVKA